jgi:hypothetical protein
VFVLSRRRQRHGRPGRVLLRLVVAALVPLAVVVAVRRRFVGEEDVLRGGGAAAFGPRVAPSSSSGICRASASAGPAVPGKASSGVTLSPDVCDEDDEVVPVSAEAGAAMATTVPPRAARPKVKSAAVLAIRVLIM